MAAEEIIFEKARFLPQKEILIHCGTEGVIWISLGVLKAQFSPLYSRRHKVFSQRHHLGARGSLFVKSHEKM